MKVFRIVLVLCLAATALAAPGDRTATADSVTAEFLGSSGGMKLSATELSSAGDIYVMVQQEKLAETGTGCPGGCTSINVAGQNSWTEVVETQTDKGTVYSTTFSVEQGGVSFRLMAHLGTNLASEVEEVVPCSVCASETSGVCKAEDGVCSDFESESTCSTGSTPCTESVTVYNDELKFSFVVSGFTFASPDNKFVYGIVLKDKANSPGEMTSEKTVSDQTVKEVKLPDALLVLPTKGLLKGGAGGDVEVEATITKKTEGQKTVISFEFDSWSEGLSLYYDPSMTLSAAYSSGASKVVSAALVAISALVLAV